MIDIIKLQKNTLFYKNLNKRCPLSLHLLENSLYLLLRWDIEYEVY